MSDRWDDKAKFLRFDSLSNANIAQALREAAHAQDAEVERIREALIWAMTHVENVFALAGRHDSELPELERARQALSTAADETWAEYIRALEAEHNAAEPPASRSVFPFLGAWAGAWAEVEAAKAKLRDTEKRA